jgi:RNA polymerase sigma-70 factor (ECF subfamily)
MDEQERAADVKRVLAGDGDALQRLIIHYHPTLRVYVVSALANKGRTGIDVDDVLQQAYVTAFRSLPSCRFDGPGGFYKWLETIAWSRLVDQLRKRDRDPAVTAGDLLGGSAGSSSYPDLFQRLAGPESTPSHHVARDEAIAMVMSCLARLTNDQRAVVRMRFLEGRAVGDIAGALEKTEPAIHQLCHRGLKELRKHLVSLTRFLTRS